MKQQSKYHLITSLILTGALTACGGGSSTTGGDSGGGTAALTLSGTAATGAPFADASISIFDSSNAEVGSGTSLADGSYQITLTAGAKPPFVLKAVRADLTLVSLAASDSGSTVNITPITNLIASRLSPSGDPAKLAAELKADPTLLEPLKVNAKVDEIVALLQPLLDAVGASANPLTGKFAADGTGSDRALDSLLITITPSGPASSNIEVALKQVTTDGTQPAAVMFTSASSALPTLPPGTAATLTPSGTAPLIANFLQRLSACFALPVAERVSNPNPASASATEVLAPACKTIFHNDDPASYKGNGKVVGVGSKTAFNGIFRDGATGMVFDQGSYEFTRDNTARDLVIGYRSIDKNNNVTYDTLVLRPDNPTAPTKLSLIGNQYDYEGGVNAFHQLREFPRDKGHAYYSTGYAFVIPAAGLAKVIVTSPRGNTLPPLIAGTGYNNLTFSRGGNNASGASFIRMRSVYANQATIGDPSTVDTSQFFAPVPDTDEQIASYPAQSSWKFEYFVTGNVSSTPDAVQYHKTRARPLTIAELQARPLVRLTDQILAEIDTGLSATGLALDGNTTETIDWTVPDGALAPTTIRLYGRKTDKSYSFDDAAIAKSGERSATIVCFKASPGDLHCNPDGTFVTGLEATGLQLWAREATGREFTRQYAFYGLNK